MSAKPRLRPWAAALAVTGTAIAMLAGSGVAAADGDRRGHHRGHHGHGNTACTVTDHPHDYVCVKVVGDDTEVDDVYVARIKLDGDKIKHYKAVVWVREPDGDVEVFRSHTRHDSERGHAIVKVDVDEEFENRSILCGGFYEEGDLQGVACVRLKD